MAKLTFSEVVRTIEVEPIALAGGGSLRLRLEVLRNGRRYVGRVYRWEFFRIQPTFPQRNGRPAHAASDEMALVRDEGLFEDIDEASVAKVVKSFSIQLEKRFGVAPERLASAEAEHLFVSAWRLLDSGQSTQGFKLLLAAAARGHVAAQGGVGYLYDVGKGVARSRRAALTWYRKAARAGDPASATNLGLIYRDQARRRARRWFLKALALGDGDVLLELARLDASSARTRSRAIEHLRQLLRLEDVAPATREEAELLLVKLSLGQLRRPRPSQ